MNLFTHKLNVVFTQEECNKIISAEDSRFWDINVWPISL